MPIFRYVAKDKSGKIHRGKAEAADKKALIKQLGDAGYWVTQTEISSSGNANASRLPADNTNANPLNADDAKKAKLLSYIAMGLMLAIAAIVFSR